MGEAPAPVFETLGRNAANYAPLTLVSHMLDRTLFGANLGGHHLTSVALHASNAVLLFLVLVSMTAAWAPSAGSQTSMAVAKAARRTTG